MTSQSDVPDPKGIFQAAECFYQGSMSLHDSVRPGSVHLLLPSATVLGALALELYLKCIFVLENGRRHRKIHSLRRLFDELSSEARAEIRRMYDNPQHPGELEYREAIKNPPPQVPKDLPLLSTAFDDVIKLSSEAFEKWRYLHESAAKQDEFGWNAGYLIRCTRLYIIRNHHADWGLLTFTDIPESPGVPPTPEPH